MPRDIDQLIGHLRTQLPAIEWHQLEVKHPGVDDDGLWFFKLGSRQVQVESPNGCCPFLVEAEHTTERYTGHTVPEVLVKVAEWLRP